MSESVIKEDKKNRIVNCLLQWLLVLSLLGVLTVVFSCLEIISFKIYLDNTKAEGAAAIPFIFFIVHYAISGIVYGIQKRKNHHTLEYTEYLVPKSRVQIIAVAGAFYYIIICLMTPHIQATHLVVLMQSSCVFTTVIEYFFELIDWTWVRSCQCALGITSLLLIFISLYVSRNSCCMKIVIATFIFTFAVFLNSYTSSLTTHTLLTYPSMQSQFEYNVYKYQLYSSVFLVFILYAIRSPNTIDFVSIFDFIKAIFDGCRITIVERYNWIYMLVYLASGLLYDRMYSALVLYSNPTYSSCIQVISFILTLVVMWNYENSTTPAHDPLNVIAFVLFSGLLFWEGVSAPVFRTHRGSFFENQHTTDSTNQI